MTRPYPLQPAKAERNTAVASTTSGIAFMENINHLLSEAAWNVETKHNEQNRGAGDAPRSLPLLFHPLVGHKTTNIVQGSLD